MKLERGYIHLYTGDGKGKTTAALGQALRALGHGFTVRVIQFMKGNIEYGELEMSRRLSPQFILKQMGRETFVSKEDPDPIDVKMAEEALTLAKQWCQDPAIDLLILDEINVALDFKLITLESVFLLLDSKPKQLELILTGRYAPQKLIDRADLVTEMREVKHYYRQGIQSRVGIER